MPRKKTIKDEAVDLDDLLSELKTEATLPPKDYYAKIARDLYDSFLQKGFTTDQSFVLTTLVLSKNLR